MPHLGINKPTNAKGEPVACRSRDARRFIRWRCLVWAACGCGLLLVVGCASPPPRAAVPKTMVDLAEIPGIPRARFWGDALPPWIDGKHKRMRQQLEANYTPAEMRLPSNYLALSGGGAKGAYGAGFINGWTKSGKRPPFLIVTGISTGGLLAPFVFAGPKYDDKLRELFTSFSTKDLVEERSIFAILSSDAFSDTKPLKRLIDRYVDQALLDDILARYREGRRLYIGTTNMDTERPVIWDITAIAASGSPDALPLIRKVLLASASIPILFPPVYFDVEINGKRYREMHVDGGATAQLFLYPAALDWRETAKEMHLDGRHRLYIIRNAKLEPTWEKVEPSIASIALRTTHSLVRTQGRGDLYRLFLGCQRDKIEYNLTYIPGSFDITPDEPFDRNYMRALYKVGYDQGSAAKPWDSAPPGFHPLKVESRKFEFEKPRRR